MMFPIWTSWMQINPKLSVHRASLLLITVNVQGYKSLLIKQTKKKEQRPKNEAAEWRRFLFSLLHTIPIAVYPQKDDL